MKKTSSLIATVLLLLGSVSYGANDPIKHQEAALVGISITQNEATALISAINANSKAVKPDWEKIDRLIIDWFDKKKNNNPVLQLLKLDLVDKYIESTKQNARLSLSFIAEGWDSTVEKVSAICKDAIKSMMDQGPYGNISGTYYYDDAQKDPGSPGWVIGPKVVWVNVNGIKIEAETGLAKSDVKVAAEAGVIVAGLSGEIVTSVESSAKLSVAASLADTTPHPADPLNKPVATTGFDAYLNGNVSVGITVNVLVKFSAQMNADIIIFLGSPSKFIESGKSKKPSDP